jgi:hypothetical protein
MLITSKIQIGNLNVGLLPPVVPNINMGASFYDLEFTREIPRGRPQVEAIRCTWNKLVRIDQRWKELLLLVTLKKEQGLTTQVLVAGMQVTIPHLEDLQEMPENLTRILI